MDKGKIVSVLNDLIEVCHDGQKGFKEAAEHVRNTELKSFFLNASQERADFAITLQQHVRAMGKSPETGGTTGGSRRRAWIELKGTFAGRDDLSILSDAERCEDVTVEASEAALKKGLPSNISLTLEEQYRQIQVLHNRLNQMRDSRATAASRSSI